MGCRDLPGWVQRVAGRASSKSSNSFSGVPAIVRESQDVLQTCMGCAGMMLTRILWSRSVLTMKRPSGLTVRLVTMLQKCPMNSCGACRVPACQCL